MIADLSNLSRQFNIHNALLCRLGKSFMKFLLHKKLHVRLVISLTLPKRIELLDYRDFDLQCLRLLASSQDIPLPREIALQSRWAFPLSLFSSKAGTKVALDKARLFL